MDIRKKKRLYQREWSKKWEAREVIHGDTQNATGYGLEQPALMSKS